MPTYEILPTEHREITAPGGNEQIAIRNCGDEPVTVELDNEGILTLSGNVAIKLIVPDRLGPTVGETIGAEAATIHSAVLAVRTARGTAWRRATHAEMLAAVREDEPDREDVPAEFEWMTRGGLASTSGVLREGPLTVLEVATQCTSTFTPPGESAVYRCSGLPYHPGVFHGSPPENGRPGVSWGLRAGNDAHPGEAVTIRAGQLRQVIRQQQEQLTQVAQLALGMVKALGFDVIGDDPAGERTRTPGELRHELRLWESPNTARVAELLRLNAGTASVEQLGELWHQRWPAASDGRVPLRVVNGLNALANLGAVRLLENGGNRAAEVDNPELLAMAAGNLHAMTNAEGCSLPPSEWLRCPDVPAHLHEMQARLWKTRTIGRNTPES